MITSKSITSKSRQTTATLTTTAIVTKTLHTLLALHLLLAFNLLFTAQTSSTINALPITSKPIENTAENIAWQAWLMLPPEQKNLEKSRKVTPKSIFTLPFRECPPGHHLYESRCIPTVSIDQSAILAQQLLGFVVEDGNPNDNNYEFDYDDTESELLTYDAPQKSNGSGGRGSGAGAIDPASSNYDDASQLPSQDAPLKFNIFQQRFPTDYEAEMNPPVVEEGVAKQTEQAAVENRTANFFQGLPISDAMRRFLELHANTTKVNINAITTTADENSTETTITTTAATDLQSESSDFSTVVMENFDKDAAEDEEDENDTPAISTSTKSTNSKTDAIVLPAGYQQPAVADANTADNVDNAKHDDLETDKTQTKGLQKLNENGKNASTQEKEKNFNNEREEMTLQSDIAQLLKADALLPLFNITQTSVTASDPYAVTVNDGKPLLGNSTIGQTEEDVTNMSFSEEEDVTTLPTVFSESLGEVVSDERIEMEMEPPKDERERSAEKELEESVTLATTDIEENPNKPESATFISSIQEQNMEEKLVDFKKSKVEPVLTNAEIATATKSTPLPTTTANKQNEYVADIAVDGDGDGDRLHVQQHPVQSQSDEMTISDQVKQDVPQSAINVAVGDGSNNNNNNLNDQHTLNLVESSKTSEIDIAEELRMINELVKGKRQPIKFAKSTTTTKNLLTKIITTTTKTSTSSTPATARKSTPGSIATTITESSLTTDTLENEAKTIESKTLPTTTTITEMSTQTILSTSKTSASSNNQYDSIDMMRAAEKSKTFKAAPAALKKIVDISSHNNKKNNYESKDIKSSNDEASTSTATTTTSATTTVSTSLEPSTTIVSTIWSKIMPMLGFGSTTEATVTTTATTIPDTSPNLITTPTTQKPQHSINSNRSNRNSKIIRINQLETTNIAAADNADDIDAVTESNSRPISTTTKVPASKGFEPFWWLPTGWRLDRQSDNDNTDVEQSLLLRFWSVFPGNQTKVRK